MMTRRRDEQGAIAILTGLIAVVLLACSALAVDIASLSSQRQQLHDTVDTSALSGALLLPDGSAAEAEARAVAFQNDADATPAVKFYCIVGSKGTPPVVDTLFIPTACNPGAAPYVDGAFYPGLKPRLPASLLKRSKISARAKSR